MRFSNGMWLDREGWRIVRPAEVYAVRQDGDRAVELVMPTRPVRHRGDTVGAVVLWMRVSAPHEGMLRVQVWHHRGGGDPRPAYAWMADTAPVAVSRDGDTLTVASGSLRAVVNTAGPFGVAFWDGDRRLTAMGPKDMGYAVAPDGTPYVYQRLGLQVGEWVYGLGERFTPFVKNGQTVDIWNEDGGTSTQIAYKNIPFYVTNRGYGVLVNDPGPVSFEVASEWVSRVQFSVPGECLDYTVIGGPTPKEVIRRYTALTGRPALPPAWSFGLWLSTSFVTNYDAETVLGMVDEMARRGIPVGVFHFDCFWMPAWQWTSFAWDPATFPDPDGLLKALKARGIRVSVWINPYIAQDSPLFPEAAKSGYLLRRPDGRVWQTDLWQPGMGIVDFTNPAARAWFQDHLRRLVAMGVDTFKTDFGERIPVDVQYWDGSDPIRMHNYYTDLYNRTVFEVLEAAKGRGQAVVFARSATAGGQRFPVHWGGDCLASYESMAESLRGGLSLALSGFAFWSHDIGGFEDVATPDLYKRWVAFGLLSSHSRLHGSAAYKVPWVYDEEAVAVLRHFVELKRALLPYLFGAALEATREGMPVMRPMLLEFPDDPTCQWLDRQYLLGPDLLVAPIFSPDGDVEYYLPDGRWTHLLTGEARIGGRWWRDRYDYFSLPLYVREGALVPCAGEPVPPDGDWTARPLLVIGAVPDGLERVVTLPRPDGTTAGTAAVRRTGDRLVVSYDGDAPWSVLLLGRGAVDAVEGGAATRADRGLTIAADAGRRTLTLRLTS